jgi:hypothetical protein
LKNPFKGEFLKRWYKPEGGKYAGRKVPKIKKPIGKKVEKPSANREDIKYENLPIPWVHYSDWPIWEIGFSEKKRSKIYLCSCFKKAIENKIFHYLWGKDKITFEDYHISTWRLEEKFLKQNKDWFCSSVDEGINKFSFKENLCHECNQAVPSVRFSNTMYGRSRFEAEYGWYIRKVAWELGIASTNWNVEKRILSSEIRGHTKFNLTALNAAWERLQNEKQRAITVSKQGHNGREIENEAYKQWVNVRRQHIICEDPENVARARFGFQELGHSSIGETTLYNLVKKVFPVDEVQRHYRPDWLDRLELDIFVHELNLGIEYQGQQHFEAVEHWGGEEALKRGKERDEKKRQLCQQNNVSLIYFYYNETLTEEIVKRRLKKYLK